jgi:hypothetical protein
MTRHHSPFELALSVSAEDVQLILRGFAPVPWSDFLLNPRRLRGSDFLMRWSQGEWSEQRLIQAVGATGRYFAMPYGPSGVAPNEVREFELYFERLDAAGLGNVKRPDLLIYRSEDRASVETAIAAIGGITELPFTPEADGNMKRLLEMSVIAVECDNSLWVSRQMPDFGSALTVQKRLGGHLGLKKSAVVPTIIIKEEDREPLRQWERVAGKPIHIWHVFYDAAYGISLSDAETLFTEGKICGTEQVFQAPGGPTTKKIIYKIYYHHAYPLADASEEPRLEAASITDKNGHILPYVKFQGGKLTLTAEAAALLNRLSTQS